MSTHSQVRCCSVYRGRGEPDELSLELTATPPAPSYDGPIAERVPLRAIMARELICARPDLAIAELVGLMMRRSIGCVPVVDERRRPIGVVTKYDLVEQLDAAMRSASHGCAMPPDLAAQTAEDVMMPIALALDEHATLAHAAAMMMSEGTHHVLVVDGAGALVGVVSAKDIVGWVVEHGALAAHRDASRGPGAWRPLEG